MKKQAKIDSFFDAYSKRDFEGIKKVMDRRITWFFLGQHPLAGVKHGLDEVISFFDAMGEIMAVSNGKNGKVDYRRKRSLRDRVPAQQIVPTETTWIITAQYCGPLKTGRSLRAGISLPIRKPLTATLPL